MGRDLEDLVTDTKVFYGVPKLTRNQTLHGRSHMFLVLHVFKLRLVDRYRRSDTTDVERRERTRGIESLIVLVDTFEYGFWTYRGTFVGSGSSSKYPREILQRSSTGRSDGEGTKAEILIIERVPEGTEVGVGKVT